MIRLKFIYLWSTSGVTAVMSCQIFCHSSEISDQICQRSKKKRETGSFTFSSLVKVFWVKFSMNEFDVIWSCWRFVAFIGTSNFNGTYLRTFFWYIGYFPAFFLVFGQYAGYFEMLNGMKRYICWWSIQGTS